MSEREKIQDDLAEFRSRGGKVRKIPFGVLGGKRYSARESMSKTLRRKAK